MSLKQVRLGSQDCPPENKLWFGLELLRSVAVADFSLWIRFSSSRPVCHGFVTGAELLELLIASVQASGRYNCYIAVCTSTSRRTVAKSDLQAGRHKGHRVASHFRKPEQFRPENRRPAPSLTAQNSRTHEKAPSLWRPFPIMIILRRWFFLVFLRWVRGRVSAGFLAPAHGIHSKLTLQPRVAVTGRTACAVK